jgi:hypothetical protein
MASSSDQAPLLPGSLRARLEAFACAVLGYALMGLCLAAAASLLTWSAADPSFVRTADGSVRNALGPMGASFADLAMRLFGLAAVVVVLPPAFWALQLITRRQLEDGRMKLMLAPAAVLLLACATSGLPIAGKWPLPYGLGGLLGDQALKSLSGVFVAAGPEWTTAATALFCLAGGLILLTGSLGMSLRDLRLICQVRLPRLQLLGRARRWLQRALDQGRRDRAFVRLEPTLDPPPAGVAVVSQPFPVEPAFDFQPRMAPAPASTHAPAAPAKRLEVRRPVRDPEFERTTETGCRAMAERFAPTREEPAAVTGPGLLRRALPQRGSGGAGERLPGAAEPRPVWPGSVPAAVEAGMPPVQEDYPPGRSASDELYGRAVAVVRAERKASAEYLQQRLGIAYMQAANLIDRMEQEGIVGAPIYNGVRPILGGPSRPRTV